MKDIYLDSLELSSCAHTKSGSISSGFGWRPDAENREKFTLSLLYNRGKTDGLPHTFGAFCAESMGNCLGFFFYIGLPTMLMINHGLTKPKSISQEIMRDAPDLDHTCFSWEVTLSLEVERYPELQNL